METVLRCGRYLAQVKVKILASEESIDASQKGIEILTKAIGQKAAAK